MDLHSIRSNCFYYIHYPCSLRHQYYLVTLTTYHWKFINYFPPKWRQNGDFFVNIWTIWPQSSTFLNISLGIYLIDLSNWRWLWYEEFYHPKVLRKILVFYYTRTWPEIIGNTLVFNFKRKYDRSLLQYFIVILILVRCISTKWEIY